MNYPMIWLTQKINKLSSLIILSIVLSTFFASCKKQENAQPTQPIDIFNTFWNDFDRTYPYFVHKQINWDSLYTVYVSQINENTTSEELFDKLGELSLELKDIHVYLSSSIGDYHYSKKHMYPENPPLNAVNYLTDVSVDNSKCVFGRIDNTNYSYLQVKSFTGQESEFTQGILSLDSIKNRDGLVIDIRHNSGGNELNGRAFARRFIKNDTIYKYARVRDGSGWNEFSNWHASILPAANYLEFNKPVILLTNRRVYSSAELFALMMKSYPNLIIVGDTTGAASANPAKRNLPNGWDYYVSTWQAAGLDYLLIEDNGIAPDHYVLMTENSIDDGKDLILEKAVDLLDDDSN